MTASTCKSSALMFCTSECFDLSAEGNALGLEIEVMTLDEVSLVYWKQSSHLTISFWFWPGTIRGKREPQESQKRRLAIATIVRLFACRMRKICVRCLVCLQKIFSTFDSRLRKK